MILVSPWSRVTTDGKPSPKNYPHWGGVVGSLRKLGHDVAQVSRSGEADVSGAQRMNDLPLSEIASIIKTCDTWASVDNFFHHMAWMLGQPGVVIFGMSDPEIFGHPENINLIKDRRFLRQWQFRHWSQEPENPAAFVPPEAAVAAIMTSISRRRATLR